MCQNPQKIALLVVVCGVLKIKQFISNYYPAHLKDPTPPNPPYISKVTLHFSHTYFSPLFISNHNSANLRDPTPPNPPYISQATLHFGSYLLSPFFISSHNPANLRDPTPPNPPYIYQATLHSLSHPSFWVILIFQHCLFPTITLLT